MYNDETIKTIGMIGWAGTRNRAIHPGSAFRPIRSSLSSLSSRRCTSCSIRSWRIRAKACRGWHSSPLAGRFITSPFGTASLRFAQGDNRIMIIDVHNHFSPPEYLAAVKAGDSNVKLTIDAEGNPCVHYPGDYNVAVRGHRDIAYRQTVIEKEGVDTQIITFTTPGTHVETPERAVRFARLVNDAYAKIVKERAPRFNTLATLPLCDPAASVTELTRAMTQLKFSGAMVFSNVNGVALADKRFEPLWAEANKLGAVIHIHPTDPVGVEAMTDFWLMPLVGFLFDTTLAASKLVFAGVPEKYPKITWVLTHLGGAIPYLAERLDRGHRAFKECRVNIQRPPSEYLK